MRGGIVLSVSLSVSLSLSFALTACGGTDFKGFDASDDGSTSDATKESGGSSSDASSDGPADGSICNGTHPIVDGGARFCNPGDCYCMPNDKCLPMGIAQACCNVTVKCN